MAKYKQVPKDLKSLQALPEQNEQDPVTDNDEELLSPDDLFGEEVNKPVNLTPPEQLFANKRQPREIKLKSPEELFGKIAKKDSKTQNLSSSKENNKS